MKAFAKLYRSCMALLAIGMGTVLAATTASTGAFKIVFPQGDWKEIEAPPALKQALSGPLAPKLIVHAVSEDANLRLFVTRFDYPPIGNVPATVRGYIGGLRGSLQNQGALTESEGALGNLPTYTFTSNHPEGSGKAFFQATSILCDKSLYSVQVVGAEDGRELAAKCLEGITVSDPALPAASVQSALRKGGSSAYETGRRVGYAVGFLAPFVLIGLIVLFFVRRGERKRKTPPPLPPVST